MTNGKNMKASENARAAKDATLAFRKAFKKEGVTSHTIHLFQNIIYHYYTGNARKFPWRNTRDPYHILVSEIMLQQTQTERVLKKYGEFISTFPTVYDLAQAPLRDVLAVWQGLGYNRRAIALKTAAETVTAHYNGVLPTDASELMKLPGIGTYTASAICAFAFNQPTILIETNIRAVFIYFFFYRRDKIADSALYPLVKATLDVANPREWYYALMDYGVMVKQKYANPARRSVHYHKQSSFEGSDRQIRGMILKVLTTRTSIPLAELIEILDVPSQRADSIIEKLQSEGFIQKRGDRLMLV